MRLGGEYMRGWLLLGGRELFGGWLGWLDFGGGCCSDCRVGGWD